MFDQRLLIACELGEWNRKLTVRSRSPPGNSGCALGVFGHSAGCGCDALHIRARRPAHAREPAPSVRSGEGGLLRRRSGLTPRRAYAPGAPTSFPSGETAYQVPPTPCPLVSPAFASPEKV